MAEAGAPLQTQWISVCRCNRPYSPGSQFSIDVCANCKRRVATGATTKIIDLCSCETPNPKKIPTHIKQNEKDSVTLDLASIGMAPEGFPLEKYTPIGILGESTRANVILARDRQRGIKVAVKCFKKMAPSLQSAFESDARKNKQLTHTNIVKLIDFGFTQSKAPYLVSEYKDAFNLEQNLALHGTPSHDVAVKILISVCEALIYAQTQSVMHRDLRPGNIFFVDDMNSEVSILVGDFALPKVKASEELTDIRDALYMSADEARGLDFNEKSEVYTIGCVGYALLTGKPPFEENTVRELKNVHGLKLWKRISDVKFDNSRPKDLEEVIERCLEKDPNVRFESVAKLMERLEVFPRRVQMRIAAVQAAKRRVKLVRIAVAGLVVTAICAVGYIVTAGH